MKKTLKATCVVVSLLSGLFLFTSADKCEKCRKKPEGYPEKTYPKTPKKPAKAKSTNK
jgi:hypothetical protein